MAVPDCRYPSSLPNGPYQITGSYANNSCQSLEPINPIDNTGDPVHRFFQMWQQSDCSVATERLPTRSLYLGSRNGRMDLTGPPNTDQDTAQGSVAMGFFNMAQGDLPYLQSLAQTYSINDNYHQHSWAEAR
jgi:hypothetical protein